MTTATTSSAPLENLRPWSTTAPGLPVSNGNVVRVFDAALTALRAGEEAVLALVLETEGSTYAGRGAMALFGHATHAGWLSGGCLEPEIGRRASQAASTGAVGWLEIDTRDDASLISGSAVGCRGRLRLALLPLHQLPGVEAMLEDWLEGQQTLFLSVAADGTVKAGTVTLHRRWQVGALPLDWSSPQSRWTVSIARPPEALILGAGPETPALAPLLRELGWRVQVCERRPRWRDGMPAGSRLIEKTPVQALGIASGIDAALVMHHNFELDREALAALAPTKVPFIGLLGPPRRQEDLFKLLAPDQRAALQPRLRSPVGLDLGGHGPEAIALSIAAQLQAWRHGADG